MKIFKISNLILTTVLLISIFLVNATTVSQTLEYDPWIDLDDDGDIDLYDAVNLLNKYGTKGDPFLAKAGLEYDSGWINITDKAGQYFNITHNLNSTEIIVDITGKTTQDGGVHQRHLGLTNYAQGWNREYGGSEYDCSRSVVQTSDGGYALAGYTYSFGAGNADFWLVKTDWTGNVQWNRTYGGIEDEKAYSMVQTSDGGYALAGYTYSFGAGNADFWLVKTYPNGTMQWSQTYGGTGSDKANSLIQTSDGGYALAGYTSFEGGDADFWLVKTDWTGNVQWNRTYGEEGHDDAKSVVQTSDGGYGLAGFGFSNFVKTDDNGNMMWSKTYGGSVHSMVQTNDGFALAGSKELGGWSAFWLAKTDEEGNLAWEKRLWIVSPDEWSSALCIIQMDDGGYAIAGWTEPEHMACYEAVLVKTDSTGNIQWCKTYEGGGAENPYDRDARAHSVVQTLDHGLAIAGEIGWPYWLGSIGSHFWLAKTPIESGLAWTVSTFDTITLYKGETDTYWNYVCVRIWKIKETP